MSAVLDVVRAEWFKVWHKRRMYILGALYWVVLPILALVVARVLYVNLTGSFADDGVGVDSMMQQFASPFGLARLMLVGPAYMSPTFFIVAVTLIAALLIGDERGQNMWKTVLVVQPNRAAVMTGKIVVALGALGVLLAGAVVSGALFGAIGTLFLPTSFAGDWASLLGLYGLQWAFLLAPVLLAFLLILVVRSGVLGVVMVLFLPALLEGLYAIVTTISQLQPLNRINALFQTLRLRNVWEALPEYFFTSNLYAPARQPVQGLLAAFGEGAGAEFEREFSGSPVESLLGGVTLSHAVWVMALYSLLFGALLFWSFLRRDID